MDGHKNVTAVKIDPEVAGDVEMLQDLVMAACNEAAKKVDEETQRRWAACWAAWACLRACSRRSLMPDFAAPLQRLIDEFRRLPGIGQKSAQRLAFHVLRTSRDDAARLAQALLEVKDKLGLCAECNNISDSGAVPLLPRSASRPHLICVVEEPHNILPIETTRTFDGLYHVLHGSISPLRGIGPGATARSKACWIASQRRSAGRIILATNPTVEGEATAVYLSRLLKPLGMKVTRIAMGIPVGSDLEFADEVTMSKSLENRREM